MKFLVLAQILSHQPLFEIATPPSIYSSLEFPARYVGDRPRYSTCGGVSWFHNDEYLAIINFEAGCICTYKIDLAKEQCTPLQIIYGEAPGHLISAENLSVSPDGNLLAVSVTRTGQVNVYEIDKDSHCISPKPVGILTLEQNNVHGVRFANQGNYLACTEVKTGAVFVYKYTRDREMAFEWVCKLENTYLPVKAKSIDFTKDDRFVAIVFAANVKGKHSDPAGVVAIHSFDKKSGSIGALCDLYRCPDQFRGGEDIRFLKDDSHFLVSDHVHDQILVYSFDKSQGKIKEKVFEIGNPEARLSFPHGLGLSADGRYFGVANYGNDNVSIYRLNADPSN